jgi:hypothetical protein
MTQPVTPNGATQMSYLEMLRTTGVLEALSAFAPRVAGTPPLGIALPDSDIDILCYAPDAIAFTTAAWTAFSRQARFSIRQWTTGEQAVICTFQIGGWDVELFGSSLPVDQQAGWRHFEVERRLLQLGGENLRQRVMYYRRRGLKTEPAFTAARYGRRSVSIHA